jgi:hypothetical protein
VRLHRLAVVTARHQDDGRPEGAKLDQVSVPVLNPGKDRRQQGILPDASLEGIDQFRDYGLCDTGASGYLIDKRRAAVWLS